MPTPTKICFVTGTRAEFGLMRSTLVSIAAHPQLSLQLLVTGMHLDRTRGRSIDTIREDGWRVDATVKWPTPSSPSESALVTGRAIAGIARALDRLNSDIVLVVGDRVEAFAAATAAHIGGRIVAHVHGGDRALGQVDDSLRHAITKLAHLHFPATKTSATRIERLGEDRWRVHRAGSPGIDDIAAMADQGDALREELGDIDSFATGRFALIVMHPTGTDPREEHERAEMVLTAALRTGVEHLAIVYPNTDPGAAGIMQCWDVANAARNVSERAFRRLSIWRDLPRPLYLSLLRDAAMLIGNSSSGIIEAASFGTPVVDVGPRQLGRERGGNVVSVPFGPASIRAAIARIWNNGKPRRCRAVNVYGAPDGASSAAERISHVLAITNLRDERLRRKLIAY